MKRSPEPHSSRPPREEEDPRTKDLRENHGIIQEKHDPVTTLRGVTESFKTRDEELLKEANEALQQINGVDFKILANKALSKMNEAVVNPNLTEQQAKEMEEAAKLMEEYEKALDPLAQQRARNAFVKKLEDSAIPDAENVEEKFFNEYKQQVKCSITLVTELINLGETNLCTKLVKCIAEKDDTKYEQAVNELLNSLNSRPELKDKISKIAEQQAYPYAKYAKEVTVKILSGDSVEDILQQNQKSRKQSYKEGILELLKDHPENNDLQTTETTNTTDYKYDNWKKASAEAWGGKPYIVEVNNPSVKQEGILKGRLTAKSDINNKKVTLPIVDSKGNVKGVNMEATYIVMRAASMPGVEIGTGLRAGQKMKDVFTPSAVFCAVINNIDKAYEFGLQLKEAVDSEDGNMLIPYLQSGKPAFLKVTKQHYRQMQSKLGNTVYSLEKHGFTLEQAKQRRATKNRINAFKEQNSQPDTWIELTKTERELNKMLLEGEILALSQSSPEGNYIADQIREASISIKTMLKGLEDNYGNYEAYKKAAEARVNALRIPAEQRESAILRETERIAQVYRLNQLYLKEAAITLSGLDFSTTDEGTIYSILETVRNIDYTIKEKVLSELSYSEGKQENYKNTFEAIKRVDYKTHINQLMAFRVLRVDLPEIISEYRSLESKAYGIINGPEMHALLEPYIKDVISFLYQDWAKSPVETTLSRKEATKFLDNLPKDIKKQIETTIQKYIKQKPPADKGITSIRFDTAGDEAKEKAEAEAEILALRALVTNTYRTQISEGIETKINESDFKAQKLRVDLDNSMNNTEIRAYMDILDKNLQILGGLSEEEKTRIQSAALLRATERNSLRVEFASLRADKWRSNLVNIEAVRDVRIRNISNDLNQKMPQFMENLNINAGIKISKVEQELNNQEKAAERIAQRLAA